MYGMQCNDIISNIVFIRMFFTLFSNKNNYNKIRFFFQIIILEHLHFSLANRACPSHLLCGQLHLLVCNCLIGTHMCVHPVSKWSVFFTLQFELFTSYNVSNNASLVYAWTGRGGDAGEGGGGEGWVTNYGHASTGGGGSQKFPNLCGHPLRMTLLW